LFISLLEEAELWSVRGVVEVAPLFASLLEPVVELWGVVEAAPAAAP
jgi:hypothetical protein